MGPKALNRVAIVRHAESILQFDPGVCIQAVCLCVFLFRLGRSGEYRGTTVGLMCLELITR